MSVGQEPPLPPSAASEAAVLCPKCQTQNEPALARCSACGADLLPGRSGWERVGYLVVGILFTAAVVRVAMVMASRGTEVPLCASPAALALWAVAMFIGALRLAFGRTPPHEKYLNRAQRHLDKVPLQALSDLTQALNLAPPKQRPAIHKQRGELLSKLGRAEEALDDLAEYVAAPEPGGGARLLGRVSDIEIEPSADARTLAEVSRLQKQLVEAGARQWIGYCQTCRAAVGVDADKHCERCGKTLKTVLLVQPGERDEALARLEREQVQRRRRRTAGIAVAGALLIVCVVLPLMSVVLRPSTRTARATPTRRATATAATPGAFRENVFAFAYPTGWQLIGPSEVSALLKTSLKGLESSGYSYIGGVYHNGLDNCQGCAQVVLVVARNASLPGGLSEAQYQAFREASQTQMGARLLVHRMCEVSGMPAAESLHLGLSGDSKVWEFIVVPEQRGVCYLVSCSSHKDTFDLYEDDFQHIIDSLSIGGGATPARTAAATPKPKASPAAAQTYTVKSGDTLGQIAKQFGTTVDALAAANGIADPNLIRPGQVLTIPLAAP